eukprot:5276266-Alexandrium_andersonii.AAC.1
MPAGFRRPARCLLASNRRGASVQMAKMRGAASWTTRGVAWWAKASCARTATRSCVLDRGRSAMSATPGCTWTV